MPIDKGRLLRLIGVIEGTLESATRGQGGERSPFAGEALAEGYGRYREELLALLDEVPELREELEQLCPPFTAPAPRNRTDLFGFDAYTGRATAALLQMKGWIDGLLREAQMEVEARAYAEARLKQERGVGFKPEPTA